jgi:hypothetical protein
MPRGALLDDASLGLTDSGVDAALGLGSAMNALGKAPLLYSYFLFFVRSTHVFEFEFKV